MSNNVNTFKNRLDMFTANQELIYDYKKYTSWNHSAVNWGVFAKSHL